jgi:RNA polymerase sigma-70 factor (sigma-E family)
MSGCAGLTGYPSGGRTEAVPSSPGAAGASDQADFEQLVQARAGELSRLAYLLTGDPDEADDLAADVLLAAWTQWETVRDAGSPMAYLRRMTSNMAASRIRRRQRWRARLPMLRADAETATRPPDGTSVDVRAALAALPARRRACVVLRFAFDLSEREVAEALDVSVGTVKSQTSKGVGALRDLLSDDAGSDPADPSPFARPRGTEGGGDR